MTVTVTTTFKKGEGSPFFLQNALAKLVSLPRGPGWGAARCSLAGIAVLDYNQELFMNAFGVAGIWDGDLTEK